MNFPDWNQGGQNLPAIQGPSLGEGRGAKPSEQKDQLADKTVFLQLLVNQIKYQNPMEPADSIQYVTQLNQFSATEQLVEIRKLLEEVPVAMPELADRNL